MPLSTEFMLVCACAEWPPSDARSERVRRLAQDVDPGRFVAVARHHRIMPLVHDALTRASVPVPADVAARARHDAMKAVELAAEALRLNDIFNSAGVPLLFLKGSALAERAFGSLALRHAKDIDVAVTRADVPRAWALLCDADYRSINPEKPLSGAAQAAFLTASKDSCHVHERTGTMVELHWRPSDDARHAATPPPSAWRRVALGGRLATLGEGAEFAYLCTHGSTHAWSRLKWLADVAALINGAGDGGTGYWAAAQAGGASRAAACAILLSHRLLHTPLPPGFVAPRSLRLRWLCRLSLRTLARGGLAPDRPASRWYGLSELTARLLIAHRPANYIAIVRRVIVPGEGVAAMALPRGAGFLYPLARLVLWRTRMRRR